MTKSTIVRPFGSRLFLMSLGSESVVTLTDAERAGHLYGHGLLLEQRSAAGDTINVFVDTPHDLLGFADLAAVSLMKPVCLPLDLLLVRDNRIYARLRTEASAMQLATTILDALCRPTDPAPACAGVFANHKPHR